MAKSRRGLLQKQTEARWQKEGASVDWHSHCWTKGAGGGQIKKPKDKLELGHMISMPWHWKYPQRYSKRQEQGKRKEDDKRQRQRWQKCQEQGKRKVDDKRQSVEWHVDTWTQVWQRRRACWVSKRPNLYSLITLLLERQATGCGLEWRSLLPISLTVMWKNCRISCTIVYCVGAAGTWSHLPWLILVPTATTGSSVLFSYWCTF